MAVVACGVEDEAPYSQRQQALSTTVIISQVYGGGGNSGATFSHDFIELQNLGNTPLSLAGMSLQYEPEVGTGTWDVHPLPPLDVPARGFFLLQLAGGSLGGAPLPAVDDQGAFNMGNRGGKVALLTSTLALSGACPQSPSLVDLVGYGAANCFEGSSPAPSPGNAVSIARTGCVDTDDNRQDFLSITPTPRSLSSPPQSCPADAGTPVDAGFGIDAGTGVDAGRPRLDAGVAPDAGTAFDAGSPRDAGASPDAGGAIDAGTPRPDAGPTSDAGRPGDAGTAVDAGPTRDAGLARDAGSHSGRQTETTINAVTDSSGCGCNGSGLGSPFWVLAFAGLGLGRIRPSAP